MKNYIIPILFFGLLCSAKEIPVIRANMQDYGTIDEVHENMIDNATVEKVTLYVQRSPGSLEKIERKGLLHRRKNAKANILMCHGFMCNKFDIGFVRALFGNDYNFLTFDFRAHGENTEGQVCTFGRDEALDVVAAAQFMRHHDGINQLPTFAYGFSMGAASIIEAQAKHPYLFKGLILDCPFDSVENVLKRSISNLSFSLCGYQFYVPGRQLLHKYAFHPYVQAVIKPMLKIAACLDRKVIETQICEVKPEETICKITVPCLFICCKNDEKVSDEAIKSVYEGAKGPKILRLTNGRSHCDSFVYNPELYGDWLNKFIVSILNGSINLKRRQKIYEEPVDLACGGTIV